MMPPDSFRPVKKEDGEKNVMRPQKNFFKGWGEEKRRRYTDTVADKDKDTDTVADADKDKDTDTVADI